MHWCGASMTGKAEIAVFGGTGIYDSGIITNAEEISVSTPYGDPSGPITLGTFEGRRMAFLQRHGRNHSIPPHMINYRGQHLGVSEDRRAAHHIAVCRRKLEGGDCAGRLCAAVPVYRLYENASFIVF